MRGDVARPVRVAGNVEGFGHEHGEGREERGGGEREVEQFRAREPFAPRNEANANSSSFSYPLDEIFLDRLALFRGEGEHLDLRGEQHGGEIGEAEPRRLQKQGRAARFVLRPEETGLPQGALGRLEVGDFDAQPFLPEALEALRPAPLPRGAPRG